MTPEDLYRLTFAEDAQISPDGRRVAAVTKQMDRESDGYRSTIWLVDAVSGEQIPFTSGPREDAHPRWSPDGRWLAFLSNREGEKKQVWLILTTGGEARRITDQPEGVQDFVWSPDSTRLACVARVPAPSRENGRRAKTRFITELKYQANGEGFVYDRRLHLFIVELDGGEIRQLTDGDADDQQPSWSPDGSTIAFAAARHTGHDFDTVSDIYLVSAAGGAPRRLTAGNGTCAAPAFSPDGGSIAYLGHLDPHPGGSRNLSVWRIDVDGGKAIDLTHTIDRSAVEDMPPVWSPDGRTLAFGVLDGGAVGLRAVPTDGGEVRTLVAGRRVLSSWSFSAERTRVAFTASTPTQPPELFLCELAGRLGSATRECQLTSDNDAFAGEVQLSEPEPFTFEGVDGLQVAGWVMRPAGGGDLCPTLLNIHGGPHASYGWNFFDEFQVQAGAGYAVVYLNPRGSQGYGESFARAVCGDWGGNDYDDVMSGLDAALERFPFLDPSRLGVLGGSYGGFMTSWIVGHTDRFQAAISERAVNAPVSLYGTSDIGFWFEQFEIASNPLADRDRYWERSPLTYADHIQTPLLIMHSENDLRCPIEQAEQLYVAVKLQRRADVVFVRFPEESHELTRSGKPSRRVERFQIVLDWFDHHLRRGEDLKPRSPELQETLKSLAGAGSLVR
jgi:dipeptidyl aminopeptidase/acylaminoacyl peptidase